MRSKRLLATAALTVTALVCAVGTTSLPAAASTVENTPLPGGPMVQPSSSSTTPDATLPTIAYNWSGYAVTANKPFTYVHATFVEPTLTCTGVADQWTSNWVGFDGFDNETVEQTGTFAWCAGADHDTPKYEAWYEMFPAASVNVFAVHAGDIIDVSVTYTDSTSDFTLTVTDLSTGKTATDVATCSSCARASAEWIIERPALCNTALTKCFITELADFGTSTMTGDEAQVDGGNVKGINGFANSYQIFMVNPDANGDGGFYTLDTISPVSGKSFSATWLEPGTTIPITL
jgi:Peptidase A4 family